MADSQQQQQQQLLMGMLAISQERAAALLQEAGGEVETAVALHFSGAGPAPAAAESPRAKLRSILGQQSCSQQQATALLRRAGGSVEAAVDMFFMEQEEAGPGPSARVQRAQSQPISISDDDTDLPAGPTNGRGRQAATRGGSRSGRGRPPFAGGATGRAASAGGGGAAAREVPPMLPDTRPAPTGRPAAARPVSGGRAAPAAAGTAAAAAAAAGAAAARPASGSGGSGGGRRMTTAGRAPRNLQARLAAGTLPRAQQPPAPPVAQQPEPSSLSASDSDESDEDDTSSGLAGAVPRRAGGMPFAVLGSLLGRLMAGLPVSDSDSEDGEQRVIAPVAELPRNTGNARVTQQLPSLQEAAAFKAHTQRRPRVPQNNLPLPSLRRSGRLHSDDPEAVPACVPPSNPSAAVTLAHKGAVRLGSVLVPLHWVNQELQPEQLGRRWESGRRANNPLPHEFLAPGLYIGTRLDNLDFAATYHSPAALERSTRLVLQLESKELRIPMNNLTDAAVVFDDNSWVPDLLYNLWALDRAGIISFTVSLHPAQRVPTAAAADGAASGASPAAGVKGKKSGGSPAGAGKGGKAGGKKAPASKSKRKGSKEGDEVEAGPSSAMPPAGNDATAAAAAADGAAAAAAPSADAVGAPAAAAVPGGATAGATGAAAAAAPAADAAGSPTHARLEVFLAHGARAQLWWEEDHCDFGDPQEDEAGRKRKKGHGGHKHAQAKRKSKHGASLAKVVAALLQFGEGLSIGPDCDGSLNFQDQEDKQAWAELPPPDSQAFRKQFDVQQLLDSVKLSHAAPAAVAPGCLSAHPKHYQLQGLQWLLDRERRGDAAGRGLLHLHPAWLQLVTPDGRLLYMHRLQPQFLSSNFYPAPVGGTCGGFLCDEMGLGKTLETLMLVASNPPPRGWAVSKLEGVTVRGEDDGEGEGEQAVPIKTTLIVVPANLLEQWADEVERHMLPGALSWCTYKPGLKPAGQAAAAQGPVQAAVQLGQRRSRRVLQQEMQVSKGKEVKPVWCLAPDGQLLAMHEADVVFMSYEQLRDELQHTTNTSNSLLHQYGFWRVVLDEAQLVANSSSVAAVMASSLWRRHAWVVTGTPITARLDEVKGLLEFLTCEPFYHGPAWRGLVQSEFSRRSPAGLLAMRALLRGVMLRRTKADVAEELELPPCTREDCWVTLSPVERLVYEQAKRGFVDAGFHVRQASDADGRELLPAARASGRGGKAAAKAMQALTALRQSCCHPQIVRRQDDLLGKERLSMRKIMERLVTQAYGEWDVAVRDLLRDQALLAAVRCGEGGHPGEALRPFLDLVRKNRDAALSTDIRHAATAVRRQDGAVELQDDPAAADGSAPSGSGQQAERSQQVAQPSQQQQQPEQRRQQGMGEGSGGSGSGSAAAAVPLAGRKRGREEEEETEGAAKAKGPVQQEPNAAAAPANGSLLAAQPGAAVGEKAEGSAAAQQQQGQQQQGQQGQGTGSLADPAALELSPEEREQVKEGRARARSWQRLELDLLELYRHMLAACGQESSAARTDKGKGKGKAAVRASKRARREGSAGPSTAVAGASGAEEASGSGSGNAAAGGSGSGEEGQQQAAEVDKEMLEAEMQEAALAVDRLLAELGLEEGPSIVRRSKRQAGVDVEEEILMDLEDAQALQEQLLHAKVILRSYTEALRRRDPEKSAKVAVTAAEKDCREKWHHLQHLLNKEAALAAAEKGKGAATAKQQQQQPEQAAEGIQQEDLNSCPICLDDLTMRTITSCGHHFCPTCIREVLATGRRVCPICRCDIREADLFDACSDEEARLQEAWKEGAGAAGVAANADYGAKVSALLAELAAMRAADPEAKAVVFSSWGRLLRLVGDALEANGVQYASLCGANLTQRQQALHAFVHDPRCAVLTVVMSTSGGAAGLTLTVASTAFLMEPSLNPGLEAQAASRIYRLGQTKPTRVIRLLAEDSVEARVLEVQKRKLESGEVADTPLQDVDPGLLLQLYDAVK